MTKTTYSNTILETLDEITPLLPELQNIIIQYYEPVTQPEFIGNIKAIIFNQKNIPANMLYSTCINITDNTPKLENDGETKQVTEDNDNFKIKCFSINLHGEGDSSTRTLQEYNIPKNILPGANILHVFAYLGIPHIIKKILNPAPHLAEQKNWQKQTPLDLCNESIATKQQATHTEPNLLLFAEYTPLQELENLATTQELLLETAEKRAKNLSTSTNEEKGQVK